MTIARLLKAGLTCSGSKSFGWAPYVDKSVKAMHRGNDVGRNFLLFVQFVDYPFERFGLAGSF